MTRRRARRGGATALLLVLTSCSISAAQPGRTSSPTVASTSRPTLIYAAIGASETLGVGARRATTEAWPQVFYRTALPRAAVYYNFGVAGDTVSGAQTDQVPPSFGVGATMVTVWLNVNDLLGGTSPATYQGQLSKLVHDLRRNGAARVLVANTPRLDRLPVYLACHGGPTSTTVSCPPSAVAHLAPAEVNGLVDAYNAAIATVVQQEGAVLVDLHAAGTISEEHPEYISVDGFHPSTAGHEAIAVAFATAYRQVR